MGRGFAGGRKDSDRSPHFAAAALLFICSFLASLFFPLVSVGKTGRCLAELPRVVDGTSVESRGVLLSPLYVLQVGVGCGCLVTFRFSPFMPAAGVRDVLLLGACNGSHLSL